MYIYVECQHKYTFKHLFKMGYKKDEICLIIKEEIFAIYFIAFAVLILHLGLFYVGCVSKGMIGLNWAMINLSICIIAIIICGTINYTIYKKEILKEIR